MLTRLQIRNFKRFDEVDIELGKNVVLIGPNNSGKTATLQALALWDIGLRRWSEKRQNNSSPNEHSGVTINRRDLTSIPVPDANLLWRDLHVRDVKRLDGKQQTQNVRIDIKVDGVTNGKSWTCGLEFDYANEESFYCRPLRLTEDKPLQRMPIPPEAASVKVAFLPPMSGLAAIEPKAEPGRINVLIGEGQTAQVLRNLCYQIYEESDSNTNWQELIDHIHRLFGVTLLPPQFVKERGEITMAYKEPSGIQLDLSCSGRGLQQTLLVLAHLYVNPHTVLLLDEPDAHLEVLRQRQNYQLLTEVADRQGSQIIAASHSEVLLNEAADRDVVIAFVGRPHRIDDGGSMVPKSLKDIGYDQYYLAEQKGWVLYLEGSTDLEILRAFADTLGHRQAQQALERPFVHYVGNQPNEVRRHYWGLKYAKSDLVGIVIFDRLERPLPKDLGAEGFQWKRRELENYLSMEEILMAFAGHDLPDDLFGQAESARMRQVMSETIAEISAALKTLRKSDPWSPDIKASDEFLDPLFEKYYEKLGLPNLMRKTDYHVLARLVPKERIDAEVAEKLDAIVAVAARARSMVG